MTARARATGVSELPCPCESAHDSHDPLVQRWRVAPFESVMSAEEPSGRDARFRRSHRLRKRWEFLAVQGRGRKIHLQDLLVLVLPRAGGQRMGVTVSSKVGGAVVRNRIKRLVREAWRRERGQLPVGLDIVFIAKKRATGARFAELRRQLQELGRRLGRSS